jgi:hypothetical protein
MAEENHLRVLSIKKDMGTVLSGIVGGHPLFEVFSGCGQLSKHGRGDPQRLVGLQEERWVMLALGTPEELLSEFVRGLQLRPNRIKHPQAH